MIRSTICRVTPNIQDISAVLFLLTLIDDSDIYRVDEGQNLCYQTADPMLIMI